MRLHSLDDAPVAIVIYLLVEQEFQASAGDAGHRSRRSAARARAGGRGAARARRAGRRRRACRRAPPRACSARWSATGWCEQDGLRGAFRAGPVHGRATPAAGSPRAHRRGRRAPDGGAGRGDGGDDQRRRRLAGRRRAPRAGREPPLPRHEPLGRAPGPVPLHRPTARSCSRSPPPARPRATLEALTSRTITERALLARRAREPSAARASRPPSTSSSWASARSPRRCSTSPGARSRRSASRARRCGSPRGAWPSCDRSSSSRPERSPSSSAIGPRECTRHDARRDPHAPLRGDAGGQRPRASRTASSRGSRRASNPETHALRRADPVAGGGRRALRARRLLRARDADRRPRDAGRARHPAPAARRRRAPSRSARS